MVSYFFYIGSTWYAATTRGGTGFICYQEPNTCFNTDDALFYKFGKAFAHDHLIVIALCFPATQTILAPPKAAASVLLVSAFAYLIKRIVRRERPNDHRLVEEKDHSFPSGPCLYFCRTLWNCSDEYGFSFATCCSAHEHSCGPAQFYDWVQSRLFRDPFFDRCYRWVVLGLAVAALITILL